MKNPWPEARDQLREYRESETPHLLFLTCFEVRKAVNFCDRHSRETESPKSLLILFSVFSMSVQVQARCACQVAQRTPTDRPGPGWKDPGPEDLPLDEKTHSAQDPHLRLLEHPHTRVEDFPSPPLHPCTRASFRRPPEEVFSLPAPSTPPGRLITRGKSRPRRFSPHPTCV